MVFSREILWCGDSYEKVLRSYASGILLEDQVFFYAKTSWTFVKSLLVFYEKTKWSVLRGSNSLHVGRSCGGFLCKDPVVF